MNLSIKNENYPIEFGYGALRKLSDWWDCNGPQQVVDKLQSFFTDAKGKPLKDGEFSWDAMDKIGEMVMSGMINAGVKESDLPSLNDVMDELLFGQKVGEVLKEWGEMMNKTSSSDHKAIKKKVNKKS